MAILHAGIATFLQAPPVEPDREALAEAGATVAVLGLPYDSTTVTRPGASHGPRAIRDASSHFSFGGGYHLDYDVTISDHLTLADCGDVDGAPGRAEETCARTERALDEIYAAGCFPVLLGGDHGTTIPGARAAARHVEGQMGFVMFDTHLDTAPQTGLQVSFWPDAKTDQTMLVGPLRGKFTAEAALTRLLASSGLAFQRTNERSLVVMAPSHV